MCSLFFDSEKYASHVWRICFFSESVRHHRDEYLLFLFFIGNDGCSVCLLLMIIWRGSRDGVYLYKWICAHLGDSLFLVFAKSMHQSFYVIFVIYSSCSSLARCSPDWVNGLFGYFLFTLVRYKISKLHNCLLFNRTFLLLLKLYAKTRRRKVK